MSKHGRLIDADAFAEFLADAIQRQKYEDLKVDDLLTVADVLDAVISDLKGTGIEGFKNAPTIEPERRTGKWIPCSERLPEEKDAGILKKLGIKKRSEDVIITAVVKGGRITALACTYDGKWQWDMKYAFPGYKIIAWMPLPEPYREEGDE